ncbi:MAG: hypothetical protein IH881_18380 [Myxococcales bacterium]|nr:hypothetical protein [Myxococcales bacterium]MCH7869667.1 hypothetical protein [Myxococcales bacterium]
MTIKTVGARLTRVLALVLVTLFTSTLISTAAFASMVSYKLSTPGVV